MTDIKLAPDERLDYINENLSLIQLKTGLCFGTDAYLLSAFAKSGKTGADLGTGTGVASLLALTKGKFAHMYSFEIQERFAQIAKRNASLNGLSDKMTVISEDIRNITEKNTDGCVDVVLSNPPYMPMVGGFENSTPEMNIARKEINGNITDFCACASRLLKYGGLFYTVFRPDRLCDLLYALRDNNLEPKKLVTVYPDIKKEPCLILTEAKKGASPSLVNSRPLVIYKEDNKYSEDMQRVYDNFTLSHLFR